MNPPRHQIARARAVSLRPHELTLDREWQGSRTLPFDFLVVATGTRLSPPGTMPDEGKPASVRYLQAYQRAVRGAGRIVIVGGGAVGVQMACDLKEVYGPAKTVTLVHSRERLMPAYHEALSRIVKDRFAELGVRLVTGSRVVVPPGGFASCSAAGEAVEVRLEDGRVLTADFVIQATGQTPNNQFLLDGLEAEEGEKGSVVNPRNGFVRVLPTMQFRDPRYPHLFAVGDIADSGAHKAARPGAVQASVAAKNIAAMAAGREPTERLTVAPAGIHLTLGLVSFSL